MASSLFKSAWATPISGTVTANSISARIINRFIISYPPLTSHLLRRLRYPRGYREVGRAQHLAYLRESRDRVRAISRIIRLAVGMAVGILALLVIVATLLAVPLVAHRAPAPDCVNRVGTLKGPGGAPIECVCINGTLSTCFNPGP